jgi:hypothetical protein
MFTDMFDAFEKGESPRETFYDGYVVNAIIDAAYLSAKTKLWEPVQLPEWRGKTGLSKPSVYTEYDAHHWLIKDEILPNGDKIVILKHKETGEITEERKLNQLI